METRTYTERSNARRAARAAGLDPDTSIIETDDGFEVRFNGNGNGNAVAEEAAPPSVDAKPSATDDLDIPDILKRPPMTAEQRAALDAKVRRDNSPERTIIMRKGPAKKAKKTPIAKSADKTALLLSMLKGKGATVDQLTKATGWLPHTLRARISGLAKPPHKMKIERDRKDGVTTYRIA